jgi:predicted GNAT family acetyltransferase
MSQADGHDALAIRHQPERSRFVVHLADGEAELLYGEFGEDVLDLQHTEVPRSGRGKGVGDALVRAALAFARERGARVMATCPYVQSWLRRHPDERPS